MILSVIIPTYREADLLRDLLADIDLSPEIQVIVVDKPSGDGTLDITEKFGAVYLTCENDVSAARNKGAEFATGSFLLFLDADQHLWSSTPMKDLLEWLDSNSHVRVATGPIWQAPGTSDMGSEIREAYRKFMPTLSGGYALMTKEMFTKLGGFRPRNQCFMWWEDSDLSIRASLVDVVHTLPFATIHRRGFQFRLPIGELIVERKAK